MILAKQSASLNLFKNYQSQIFTSTRSYKVNGKKRSVKAEIIAPIINKKELDSLPADDPRHYKVIKAPGGNESNSLNYNERLNKFMKVLMRDGTYALTRKLIDRAFYMIKLRQIECYHTAKTPELKAQIETNPLNVFMKAMDNCKPILKMISVSKGGITYQVPVPMSEHEREFKATKLIISSVLEKEKDVRFYDKLASELIDASLNQGKSVKKKIDIHKLAEANRAFAHFRWV